ncbi:MAG: HepT-like ribonuclease domain-containing protein [Archaeoglobaceae archaeon]
MDVCAMLVKDLGKRVEDDYSNIEILHELGILDKELAEKLKTCNGLRNWLVHRYNKLDKKLCLNRLI